MSLVCWSGGCDSTLVLHDLAVESIREHPVRAISIVHSSVPAMKQQKVARRRILKEFKKRGYHIESFEVKVSSEVYLKRSGNTQAVLWLGIVLPYLRVKEDLYFGYVRQDDVWRDSGYLYEAFRDLTAVMHKKGKMYFPLESYEKPRVLASLKKLKLLNLTWYCEGSGLRPCGKCGSCIKHRTALYQLGRWPKEWNSK